MKKVIYLTGVWLTVGANLVFANSNTTIPASTSKLFTEALRSGGSLGGGSGGASIDSEFWPSPSQSISIEEFNQIILDSGLNNPVIIDGDLVSPQLIDFVKKRMLMRKAKGELFTIEQDSSCQHHHDSQC
jgi:cyanophycinase-like exopeptidase